MTILIQALHEEHQELLPSIEQLRSVADLVGSEPVATIEHGIDDSLVFLKRQLLPHAQAEEKALYPLVAKLMGAPQATATMSRDHVEIERLIHELDALRSHSFQEQDARRVLYGLYALVKAHFMKEEDIYLPFLDARLTEQQAREALEALEKAAGEAKRQLV